MVFPLPLAPMEQYMIEDDGPTHPMTFYVRLHLVGQFDRQVFEQAVETAVGRHPLFQAVVHSKEWRTWWVAAENRCPEIRWDGNLERDVPGEAAPFDLRSQIGLRLWVCEADGHTRLWLQLHHSCCDGLGAARFAEDLLAAYAAHLEGREASFRPARAERLRDRGIYAGSRFAQWLRWPFELLCMAGSIEYFLHRPVSLAVRDEEAIDDGEQSPRLAAFRHRFSVDETEALRSAAREQGVTFNDLLLRDVFLAAQDWIDCHRTEQGDGPVRVMVPINLRTRLHADMPAANCVAMINVDRRVSRWKDPRRMLRVISWEMLLVKRLRLAVTMLRITQIVRRITGSLDSLLPTDRCLSSCVLTNLGRPLHDSPLADAQGRIRAGDVELAEIEFLPPVRPLTSAAFSVASFAGRLTVSLLADERALGPGGSKELLALYARRLSQNDDASRPETSNGL